MRKYFVEFDDIARKDLKNHYKSGNKATIKKIEKILLELIKTSFFGEGQPEELKHNFNGYWSRRINQKRPNDLSGRSINCDRYYSFCNGTLF